MPKPKKPSAKTLNRDSENPLSMKSWINGVCVCALSLPALADCGKVAEVAEITMEFRHAGTEKEYMLSTFPEVAPIILDVYNLDISMSPEEAAEDVFILCTQIVGTTAI